MNMIYEPTGKAREYAELALNIYSGCSHACSYCYAPAIFKAKLESWAANPQPRKDFIAKLEKELSGDTSHMRGKNILLSFTSDAYQPLERELCLTRRAIQLLVERNLGITVLTKAGDLAQRDFDLLSQNKKNEFATTLTTDDDIESLSWEPGAALPQKRIANLKAAHVLGIRTWVSFEPVVNPDAVYRLIEATHDFVDFYKVGKLNHNKFQKEIDWVEFRTKAMSLLDRFGKEYMIKKDLREAV